MYTDRFYTKTKESLFHVIKFWRLYGEQTVVLNIFFFCENYCYLPNGLTNLPYYTKYIQISRHTTGRYLKIKMSFQ